MLDEQQNPVPLPAEEQVMDIDQGVEVTLVVPGRSTGGIGGSGERLRESGRIRLTDKRLIFQTTRSSGSNSSFDSFSVLLHGIISTQFNQPTFSANYLSMELKPANGGGLSEGTKCEVRFKDQPLLPFVNTLEKSRERAVYRSRTAMFDDDLPTYSTSASPRPPINENVHPADPPSVGTDAPPGYEA